MFVTVEALQPFIHGPIRMDPRDPARSKGRLNPYVAQQLERRGLLRILDGPPTPERSLSPPPTQVIDTEPMTLGKSAASGEALTSSSSPAAQASRPRTSSASASGGKRSGRAKRGES